MNEIASILEEIRVDLAEICNTVKEISEKTNHDDNHLCVGTKLFDADGRTMVITKNDGDEILVEYVD